MKMKFLIAVLCILLTVMLTGCSFSDRINDAKDAASEIAQTAKDFISAITPEKDDDTSKIENLFGPYNVVYVVDGDTLDVMIDGEKTRIRLIGVNTPESVSDDENENCKEGKIASQYTKDTLENKKVYIEYDEDITDQYGRTLAYVYTEDGEMYNKTLLEKGYARLMIIQPNTKYVDEFTKLQTQAKENKIGFWDGFSQWE